MRRLTWLILAFSLTCLPAMAQQTPQWELSGGYAHLIANVGNNNLNLDGGGGALQENMNDWFGAKLEVNAFGGDTGGVHVTAQTYSFGPVFSYRRFERLTPFAHVQLGAFRASAGYLGISQPATKLLVEPGGGVDIGINPRVSVRLQGDYITTDFLNDRQHNFEFSAHLVFRIGHK
jgi:Outer membrane protein beta-barrel domain